MLAKEKERKEIQTKLISVHEDHVPDFYRQFICEKHWVADALQDEVDHWVPRNPILIDAPTGRGKTTFVYKHIIPKAIKAHKNVLIVSNRVALATQQKEAIMEALESPLRGRLTDQGIRETEDFGVVRVITYHRLPALLSDPKNKAWLDNVGFMIADEVHFFTSDSSFNANCDMLLYQMTSKFSHAIRIYMTGTSWDILYPLSEAEKKNYREGLGARYQMMCGDLYQEPRTFYYYKFLPNYSHVHLRFFDSMSDIVSGIRSSDKKWIIFVDSKEMGKAIDACLQESSIYLDAELKTTTAWYDILNQQSFKQKVLITTAVFDCGINIKDDNVRNIVIFTDDRTSLIQMLGRKRLKPNESVMLYVYVPENEEIGLRYARAKELYEKYEIYRQGEQKEHQKMRREIWDTGVGPDFTYFLPWDGDLKPSELGFFKLKRKINFYKKILFSAGNDTFVSEVCSWLGKERMDTGKNDYVDLLLTFCEEHVGKILSDEEIVTVRQLIVNASIQKGNKEKQPDRIAKHLQGALNNRLKKIGLHYHLNLDEWIIETEEEPSTTEASNNE